MTIGAQTSIGNLLTRIRANDQNPDLGPEALQPIDIVSKKPKTQLAYVLGEKSFGNDWRGLSEARKMKDNGYTQDEIFEETKWWLGHPDGKPRYEKAHGKEQYFTTDRLKRHLKKNPSSSRAREMLSGNSPYINRVYKSVFAKEYPEQASRTGISTFDEDLKKVPEQTGSTYAHPPIAGGQNLQMRIGDPGGPDRSDPNEVLVHETQHGINIQEGFAPGGNQSAIQWVLEKLFLDDGYSQESIDRFFNTQEGMDTAFIGYERLSGEAGARLVERRRDMTQEQMDADPFYKHYDVPIDKMLIRDRKTGKFGSSINDFLREVR